MLEQQKAWAGYAQNIEFASSDELIFEFVEKLFEIPANFINVK